MSKQLLWCNMMLNMQPRTYPSLAHHRFWLSVWPLPAKVTQVMASARKIVSDDMARGCGLRMITIVCIVIAASAEGVERCKYNRCCI